MQALLAAAAALLLASQGAQADTKTIHTAFGNAVWADFVGNHTIGGPGGLKPAYRMVQVHPSQVCFTTVEPYFVSEPNNTGYSKGNGGSIRVSLTNLDANGIPSSVIASTPLYNPQLVNGTIPPGQTFGDLMFPVLTFTTPACVAAGAKFGLLFENAAGDPVNNYMGVNTAGFAGANNSPAVSTDWRTILWNGASWVVRLPSQYHTPIFRLCDANAVNCIAQTYMESAVPMAFGGNTSVRQLFTPAATKTVQTCRLTVARKLAYSSPTPMIRIGFRTPTGGFIGGSYVDINLSALPVVSNGVVQTEVVGTLPTAVTLTAGVPVTFYMGTNVTGALWANPMQDGHDYFGGVGGFTGHTQYTTNGSTWVNYNGDTQNDLKFYCT